MLILSLLLLLAIFVLILFTVKLMKLMNNHSYDAVLSFLNKYITIMFIGVFVIYLSMIMVSIVDLSMNEYVFVLFIKLIIHLAFFINIFIISRHLIQNLKRQIIFDQTNATDIHKIGSQFIYMSIVEIIIGFVVGVIHFFSGGETKDFMLQTNTTLVLFILFGLILLLVSFILKKAIELYEENQLTI